MRRDERKFKNRSDQEAAPLDPVALTLALWLGFMVIVTGLARLSESAAANARMLEVQRAAQAQPTLSIRARALPYAAYAG